MKLSKISINGAANLKLIFRALKHRNYRLFFTGQSVSLIGTWMQMVAVGWLVYRLTNSPFLLGIVGFVGQIPTFLFTPFAGVFADRHNRRNMLIVTQSLSLIQALVLSVLILTNNIQVWHIVALSALLGMINSFDIPIRQAFTVEMIENREDLGNAIALNSSMVNASRLICPSIAGILIATVGEGLAVGDGVAVGEGGVVGDGADGVTGVQAARIRAAMIRSPTIRWNRFMYVLLRFVPI